MNELVQKTLIAILAGTVGSGLTYAASGVRLGPRMDAIERTLLRIETHIYQTPQPPPPKGDRQ